MATMTEIEPAAATRTPSVADLIDEHGEIYARRIILRPAPGTATVADVIAIETREDRICELVDGMLVEKVMGFYESTLACVLIQILGNFLDQHPLGIVAGESGMRRLAPDLVRIPDVSFVSWDQFPHGLSRNDPVPAIFPDLAVEVLSPSNTPAEMDRKLREYFEAGARLVWYHDPVDRSARVFTAYGPGTRVDESGTLDGGEVLPGFRLLMRDWLAAVKCPGATETAPPA